MGQHGNYHARNKLAGLGIVVLPLIVAAIRSLVRHDPHMVGGSRLRSWVYTMHDVAEEPVRVLRQGGVFQSATYMGARRFQPVFAYIRAFDCFFDLVPAPSPDYRRTVLMLGGGAFSYPKHLLTAHQNIDLDVVEYDEAMVRAAHRWFFLDELEERLSRAETMQGNSLRIFTTDARAFLEAFPFGGEAESIAAASSGCDAGEPAMVDSDRGSTRDLTGRARYDVIINDTFSGACPVASMATVEAARALRRRLAPEGLYLTNVVSRSAGRDVGFLRDEAATLRCVFKHVWIVPVPDEAFAGEDNYLLIASDANRCVDGAVPYDADFLGTLYFDA